MNARYIKAAGIHTRLLEGGDGAPVLLLHPVGFSADLWVRTIPALEDRFRLCAPDLLGHGFTDLFDGEGRTGIGPIMGHLTALVETLGWKHFSIVGSSLGGQLALLLYFTFPEHVKRLVIVGSGTALQTEQETAETLTKTSANALAALTAPTWASCRQRLANLCHRKDLRHDDVILSQLTAYAREGAVASYQELLGNMQDREKARPYRVAERLDKVRVRTLLLWGREDPRASHARADKSVSLFPDARLVTFEDCGHVPFLEQPERFNDTVGAFLAA